MKKKILLKCIFLPVVAVIIAGPLYCQQNSFTITFDAKDYSIEQFENYSFIDSEITGLYYKEGPGAPALPCLPVNFAVPYGSKFVEFSVSFDTVLIADDILIMPMQSLIPIDGKPITQKKADPLKEVYNSSNPYPENIVNFTSSQLMSCYQFFTFDVSPFMYLPLQRKLYLASSITVNLSYIDDSGFTNTNRHDDGLFLKC